MPAGKGNKKLIITIANRRGGAGKTASAHAIGSGLTRRGFRVLLVDLDSQSNLTFDTGATPTPPGILDVMTGEKAAAEAIRKTAAGDLLAASEALAASDIILKGKNASLKNALEPVRRNYDFIIIDTPPALGSLTVNALTASDVLFITAQPEIHSFHGATMLLNTAKTVKELVNPRLCLGGFILTRYNRRAILARDMLANFEDLARQEAAALDPFTVPECGAIKEAQALQTDIFTYSPKSTAAAAYAGIVQSIIDYAGAGQEPKRGRK